jgi:probable phosphoglycerate mutase
MLLVVRHGETAWNVEGRIQGHRDSPLTPAGVAQARAVAERLRGERLSALFGSDLGRAVETARHVADATRLALRLHPGLRERAYGVFEGLTWEEIERTWPEDFARARARDPEHVVPAGESAARFRERVLATLARIAASSAGKRIAIVTHGGVLDVLYREVRKLSLAAPREHSVRNATLNVFRWSAGALELERWGDLDHLDVPAREDF